MSDSLDTKIKSRAYEIGKGELEITNLKMMNKPTDINTDFISRNHWRSIERAPQNQANSQFTHSAYQTPINNSKNLQFRRNNYFEISDLQKTRQSGVSQERIFEVEETQGKK